MESLIIKDICGLFFFLSKSMQSKEITPQHVITFRWGRILLDRLIPSTRGYSSSWAREWWVTRSLRYNIYYLPKILKKITDFILSNSANLVLTISKRGMYFFLEHLSQSHRKSKIGHAPWGLFINKWLVSIYSYC